MFPKLNKIELYFGKNKIEKKDREFSNANINNVVINVVHAAPPPPPPALPPPLSIKISDRNIDKMEHNMSTIKKRVPSLFLNENEYNYYFASRGVTNLNLSTYNEFMHDQAILFFNILSRYEREGTGEIAYAVFAGNSVGMLRNSKNLPWGDDYDIIVFDEHADFFAQVISPELESYGFKVEKKIENNIDCGVKVFGPVVVFNNNDSVSIFQCDVFYSYFDNNNCLKNCGGWGLYHQKNIPFDVVYPFKRHMFHGMFLPFFNDAKKEVEICYTNINKCTIHSHNLLTGTIFYNKWENAYLDFDYIIKTSIENTKKAINSNSYIPLNEIELTASNKNIILGTSLNTLSKIKFLSYLCTYNIGSIITHSDAFEFICEHAADVKYYLKGISITYIDDGRKPSPVSPIFYMYIDTFIQSNEQIENVI
jgi:phosphorylcholine metabolism protein LicD